jgi:hypothetical protein
MKPSKMICETGDYGEEVFFRAMCGCHDPEDGHDICITSECNLISVYIQHEIDWPPSCWNVPWYKMGWVRLCGSLRLFFTGRTPVLLDEFHFTDEESIQDYIDALKEGIKRVKKFQDELKKKGDLLAASIHSGKTE